MQIPTEDSETSRIPDVLAVIGDAVPDFLWMSTVDGSPVYQNRAWREYAGLDAELFGAVRWDVLFHPSDFPLLRNVWQQAQREARTFEGEYRCRRHDGAYRWFLCRSSPLLDESGQVTHWVGTLTDIHAQKITEAELARSI